MKTVVVVRVVGMVGCWLLLLLVLAPTVVTSVNFQDASSTPGARILRSSRLAALHDDGRNSPFRRRRRPYWWRDQTCARSSRLLGMDLLSLRGGGGGPVVESKAKAIVVPPPKDVASRSRPSTTRFVTITTSLILLLLAVWYRDAWWPYVVDKQRLQQAVVQLLQGLQPAADAKWHEAVRLYSLYALGMMVWETIGLSTIPVETAAGMVFPALWAAAVASATGKLLGASLAWMLGRWKLQDYVQNHALVQSSALCQLLAAHPPPSSSSQQPRNLSTPRVGHAPWVSILLMKFSCFPETIKNYGTAALLPHVTYPWFVGGTALHGIPFTLLWTWLGHETAQQLSSSTTTTTKSRGLQLALTATLFLGFVVSPVSMALWIRDLQHQDKEQKRKAAAEAKAAPNPLISWIRRRLGRRPNTIHTA